jgi:hypothetical protein
MANNFFFPGQGSFGGLFRDAAFGWADCRANKTTEKSASDKQAKNDAERIGCDLNNEYLFMPGPR